MKEKKLILLCVFIANSSFANLTDSLVKITKNEFDRANKTIPFVKDVKIKKSKGKIIFANCKTFKDINSDNNFVEYSYQGDIDGKHQYKILKKTTYNGEEYIIVNRKKCKLFFLLGKPYMNGSIIANFDESATTDRKKILQVWKIGTNEIKKVKIINLPATDLQFTDIRFSLTNKILLKDNNGGYWKVIMGI